MFIAIFWGYSSIQYSNCLLFTGPHRDGRSNQLRLRFSGSCYFAFFETKETHNFSSTSLHHDLLQISYLSQRIQDRSQDVFLLPKRDPYEKDPEGGPLEPVG